METSTKAIIAVGIAALAAALFWRYRPPATPVVAPEAANLAASIGTAPTATSSTKVITAKPFPINAADVVASWSFKGAYTGNDTLIKQANADAVHLTGLIGKGQYDNYDLYNGIANDDGMLGDGEAAYRNYNRAIAVHPKKGLAYANLAHLMDMLRAYHTAADAYAKATAVESGMLEYHIERLTYLTRQFSTDTARVAAAFAEAAKQFGDNASTLAIEAQWLEGRGEYAKAIEAWNRVKLLSPGRDTSAIDAQVARDQAKL